MIRNIANIEVGSIVILGAGGVGFWTGVALVRTLSDLAHGWTNDYRDLLGKIRKLVICDDDTFMGGTGIFRLPNVYDLDMKKVELFDNFVSIWIKQSDDLAIYTLGEKLTSENFSLLNNVLERDMMLNSIYIDATDMSRSDRHKLWKDKLLNHSPFVVRVSYDGDGQVIHIGTSLPTLTAETATRSGYRNLPNFNLSMVAGGLASDLVLRWYVKCKEKNRLIDFDVVYNFGDDFVLLLENINSLLEKRDAVNDRNEG